jgi:hypothetical protein
MQFASADIAAMLSATGQTISVWRTGVQVKTMVVKFRKDFEVVSPFDSQGGILQPGFICATTDMDGITNNHYFLIDGKEYKYDGKPQELSSGMTHVLLGLKL